MCVRAANAHYRPALGSVGINCAGVSREAFVCLERQLWPWVEGQGKQRGGV